MAEKKQKNTPKKPIATKGKTRSSSAVMSADNKGRNTSIEELKRIKANVEKNTTSSTLSSYIDLSKNIEHGIPMHIAEQNKEIISSMIQHNIIPRKTWESALKSKKANLTPQNSERLIRMLRTLELAKDAFGDEAGKQWMERPTKVFEGKPPIAMLTNESGSRAVELFLGQIMSGFNA
jgi:putative toxin-antitoxin system antitoxin component (TIGR02293 family)